MSENDVRHIAIETINKFTEDTKLENLNDKLYRRLVMIEGEELIHNGGVT